MEFLFETTPNHQDTSLDTWNTVYESATFLEDVINHKLTLCIVSLCLTRLIHVLFSEITALFSCGLVCCCSRCFWQTFPTPTQSVEFIADVSFSTALLPLSSRLKGASLSNAALSIGTCQYLGKVTMTVTSDGFCHANSRLSWQLTALRCSRRKLRQVKQTEDNYSVPRWQNMTVSYCSSEMFVRLRQEVLESEVQRRNGIASIS